MKIYFLLFINILIPISICEITIDPIEHDRFITTVNTYDEECFFDHVGTDMIVYLRFLVTDGGLLDIDFECTFPNGSIYSIDRKREHSLQFNTTESGTFKYCFVNEVSSLRPKTIYVTYLTFPLNKQCEECVLLGEILFQNVSIENMINDLSTGLLKLKATNYALFADKKVHYNFSENTNKWIMWWAAFEAIALLVLSIGQIYYIKQFFEVKRLI